MKFIFASDSFKGSLTSIEICRLLTKAAKHIFPDCSILEFPIGDGGEGTVDSFIYHTNGKLENIVVHGPYMEKISTTYGIINNDTAIIEMASASGLSLVPTAKRDPRYTTSYGTGELIKDAIQKGFKNILIAIGGSCTNDGGIGCMRALGVQFLDKNGNALEGIGKDLINIHTIDTSHLIDFHDVHFTIMCDVDNPLCGENGATYVFGAQKGATPLIQKELEEGMCHYRDLLSKNYGIDCDSMKGAGAAGGLGAALYTFLKAEMKSGIEVVLDYIHFDDALKDVDVVISGEGRIDAQSNYGKVLSGIANHTKRMNVPLIALCGSKGNGADEMLENGISKIYTIQEENMTLEYAIENANTLYYHKAIEVFRDIKKAPSVE